MGVRLFSLRHLSDPSCGTAQRHGALRSPALGCSGAFLVQLQHSHWRADVRRVRLQPLELGNHAQRAYLTASFRVDADAHDASETDRHVVAETNRGRPHNSLLHRVS